VEPFPLALRTPILRDYLVIPKGIVGAMKLGVVHKEHLVREVFTPYTAPFETPHARKAPVRATCTRTGVQPTESSKRTTEFRSPLRSRDRNQRVLRRGRVAFRPRILWWAIQDSNLEPMD
jgi:hypothetical protein